MSAWHLLTGELARGGIGDYTRVLAEALAATGREVHVWSPDAAGVALRGATVHPLDGVGPRALRRLGVALDELPAPRRLLLQYAPQAWGMRGMNVALGRWLRARRAGGDDVRVMFHEPFFPFGWQRVRRNLLATVNRWMARDLLHASTRAYVSTDAWEPLLRPFAPRRLSIATLPIPSTIPCIDAPDRVAALRRELSEGGQRPVFVHFGTYGDVTGRMLAEVLREVMRHRPDARILLLGAGGPAFLERLRSIGHTIASAAFAAGYQAAEEVSIHLQASDVALQPYPDGANSRRTSLMACLANGVPTVSTRGEYESGEMVRAGIAYNAPGDLREMGVRAVRILDDPGGMDIGAGDRDALRKAMRAFYLREYAVERTVERLLAEEDTR